MILVVQDSYLMPFQETNVDAAGFGRGRDFFVCFQSFESVLAWRRSMRILPRMVGIGIYVDRGLSCRQFDGRSLHRKSRASSFCLPFAWSEIIFVGVSLIRLVLQEKLHYYPLPAWLPEKMEESWT